MKRIALFRISGIIIILSLLFLLIPVTPVYASSITLSPTSGRIGSTVTVTGVITPAPSVETWANIYFSPNNINENTLITSANVRKKVAEVQIPDTSTSPNPALAGNFTKTFDVPASLTDGTIAQNVTSGTYYVYVTTYTQVSESLIKAKATFTVTIPTLDPLSPASGPPGTLVVVSGSNFPPSTALVFMFDTTIITPTSGHTSTLSTGLFISSITIPTTATAGSHNLTVTAGTGAGAVSATRTFTVTASPTLGALQPTSGPPGTQVAISGTNFPPSTNITFKFDNTTLTPTGSSQTGTDGSFASVLTIPTNATAGDHIITVTVGTTSLTATFTVTGGTTTPTLNAPTPDSGPPGTDVAISGSHFAASSAITVTFDTSTITLSGSTYTSTDGSFSGVIVIPASATIGAHTITVTAGATSATTSFTVTQAEPTTPPSSQNYSLDVELGGDYVGASISIASSGFIPNHPVTVSIDGQNVTQRNATESGLFFTSVKLPALKYGEHTISATDGTNTATAIFTIESKAPNTPQPLSPAMGEAISALASFDWEDVEDDSLPITYNLQIATSKTFDTNSIVINVTGITESQYTLTEDEQLRLSSEIIYYWREQAIDAAQNASGWTGAGEFTMVKPFEFIGWPLYLTIGLGGLVLFLLGMWVGRRTAFYY